MSNSIRKQSEADLKREPLLDLFRLFACFIVIMHHATVALTFGEELEAASPLWQNIRWYTIWLTKFGHGTPIFFVLAGWLVMNTLVKSKGDRKGILKAFLRRMKRILPPYWLALGLTALLFLIMEKNGFQGYFAGGFAAEFKSPRALTTWQWVGNLTLTETWRALYTQDDPLVYTRVAWALCYHEQFIALAIAIALIVGTKWQKFLLVACTILIAFQIFIYDIGATYRFDGLFIDRWYCFAAGLLAFEIAHRKNNDYFKWVGFGVLCVGVLAGWLANDVEVSISSWAAVALSLGSHLFKQRFPDRLGTVIARLSPWTYYIYLAHFPFVTITNRFLYEYGVQSFWGRALVMVPISMIVGVIAGILFGRLVRMLERTEVHPPVAAFNSLNRSLGQWHQLPQQIWQVVAVEPILLPNWHLLPKRDRGSVFDRPQSAPVGSLSDRTPFPNAAP